jgi:SM-20-related protein
MKRKHRLTIDGRLLVVYDGFWDRKEQREFASFLTTAEYRRDERVSRATSHVTHWVLNLELDGARPLTERLAPLLKKHFGGRFEATRFYCNHHQYGDMLFGHRDCPPGKNEVTALIYANERWEKDWGGETLFFNDDDDCVGAVTPRPGRLALFHGAIPHRASAPQRDSYVSRLTLAIKYRPLKGNE